ncbi:MAG: hypothetical protein KDE35_18255, partial [Geminicoccaceae bacterium]|nr:hypothetical protein [Geminicoccaceae bacterium]
MRGELTESLFDYLEAAHGGTVVARTIAGLAVPGSVRSEPGVRGEGVRRAAAIAADHLGETPGALLRRFGRWMFERDRALWPRPPTHERRAVPPTLPEPPNGRPASQPATPERTTTGRRATDRVDGDPLSPDDPHRDAGAIERGDFEPPTADQTTADPGAADPATADPGVSRPRIPDRRSGDGTVPPGVVAATGREIGARVDAVIGSLGSSRVCGGIARDRRAVGFSFIHRSEAALGDIVHGMLDAWVESLDGRWRLEREELSQVSGTSVRFGISIVPTGGIAVRTAPARTERRRKPVTTGRRRRHAIEAAP